MFVGFNFIHWLYCIFVFFFIVVVVVVVQLVQMLGEGDEEPVPEHLVLQDKLQELQYKKQHMDHLVAEFQTLNNHPSLTTGKQCTNYLTHAN